MSHNSDVLRAALGAVRSQVLDETGIYIEGDKKVIPERYRDDPMRYVMELHDAVQSLANNVNVPKVVLYRPWDVAVALDRMFRDQFGMSLASMSDGSGRSMDVPIDAHGNTVTVTLGTYDVDFLHGTLSIDTYEHDVYGTVTLLNVNTPLRYKAEAQEFLRLVTEDMASMSIYKGKAITYGEMPTFYDIHSIDPGKVIYTNDVAVQLEADIWTRIRYMAQLALDSVLFGGAVLLHGKFGTGKTLAAGLTAQVCVANDVTFIKGNPGDNPEDLMAMARLYDPCVIFLEDADQYLAVSDPREVSKMLDTYDGLDSKGKRVLTVFTTNHVERIHAGMLRPGRLRAVIEVGAYDDDARERFIRSHISPDIIDPDLDMGPINEAMAGYVGAYVAEAIDRSKVYAYSRNGGLRPTYITTQDLVQAARSLRSQHDLHEGAQEGMPVNRLDDALRAVLVPPIVTQVNANTDERISTIPGANDLHAIVSHNLKTYLSGIYVELENCNIGTIEGELNPANPFYD